MGAVLAIDHSVGVAQHGVNETPAGLPIGQETVGGRGITTIGYEVEPLIFIGGKVHDVDGVPVVGQGGGAAGGLDDVAGVTEAIDCPTGGSGHLQVDIGHPIGNVDIGEVGLLHTPGQGGDFFAEIVGDLSGVFETVAQGVGAVVEIAIEVLNVIEVIILGVFEPPHRSAIVKGFGRSGFVRLGGVGSVDNLVELHLRLVGHVGDEGVHKAFGKDTGHEKLVLRKLELLLEFEGVDGIPVGIGFEDEAIDIAHVVHFFEEIGIVRRRGRDESFPSSCQSHLKSLGFHQRPLLFAIGGYFTTNTVPCPRGLIVVGTELLVTLGKGVLTHEGPCHQTEQEDK